MQALDHYVVISADGDAGEVLFPNTAPPFFPGGLSVGVPQTQAEYERRWVVSNPRPDVWFWAGPVAERRGASARESGRYPTWRGWRPLRQSHR